MTFNLLEKYKLKSKARTERHYANNTDALASMVCAGLGYSVLAEQFAEPLIKKNQLIKLGADYFYDFKIALAWYPRHEMPDYFRAIVKALH